MSDGKMTIRGAYVDAKGVRWDTNDADFEGYLSKQSKWVKEWRKRYFVLKGSKLFFGKSQYAAPHGILDLVDCVSAKCADSKAKKRNALEIVVNNELYLLCTSSERERDDWIAAVGRAMVKHSSMYVPMGDGEHSDDEQEEYD